MKVKRNRLNHKLFKKLGCEIKCQLVRFGMFGREGLAQKKDSRFAIS